MNVWAPSAGPVAGIRSDATASVVVHQASRLMNIAVADPAQANNGTIHIEVAAPAASVVAQDDGVTVDQIAPSVKLSISAKGSRGKTFHVTLGTISQ